MKQKLLVVALLLHSALAQEAIIPRPATRWAYTNILNNTNLASMTNGQVLAMIAGRIGATNVATDLSTVVAKAGDTMTGTLEVPDLTVTGTGAYDTLRVTNIYFENQVIAGSAATLTALSALNGTNQFKSVILTESGREGVFDFIETASLPPWHGTALTGMAVADSSGTGKFVRRVTDGTLHSTWFDPSVVTLTALLAFQQTYWTNFHTLVLYPNVAWTLPNASPSSPGTLLTKSIRLLGATSAFGDNPVTVTCNASSSQNNTLQIAGSNIEIAGIKWVANRAGVSFGSWCAAPATYGGSLSNILVRANYFQAGTEEISTCRLLGTDENIDTALGYWVTDYQVVGNLFDGGSTFLSTAATPDTTFDDDTKWSITGGTISGGTATFTGSGELLALYTATTATPYKLTFTAATMTNATVTVRHQSTSDYVTWTNSPGAKVIERYATGTNALKFIVTSTGAGTSVVLTDAAAYKQRNNVTCFGLGIPTKRFRLHSNIFTGGFQQAYTWIATAGGEVYINKYTEQPIFSGNSFISKEGGGGRMLAVNGWMALVSDNVIDSYHIDTGVYACYTLAAGLRFERNLVKYRGIGFYGKGDYWKAPHVDQEPGFDTQFVRNRFVADFEPQDESRFPYSTYMGYAIDWDGEDTLFADNSFEATQDARSADYVRLSSVTTQDSPNQRFRGNRFFGGRRAITFLFNSGTYAMVGTTVENNEFIECTDDLYIQANTRDLMIRNNYSEGGRFYTGNNSHFVVLLSGATYDHLRPTIMGNQAVPGRLGGYKTRTIYFAGTDAEQVITDLAIVNNRFSVLTNANMVVFASGATYSGKRTILNNDGGLFPNLLSYPSTAESVLTAQPGSLNLVTNGTLELKFSGAGNTGWLPILPFRGVGASAPATPAAGHLWISNAVQTFIYSGTVWIPLNTP